MLLTYTRSLGLTSVRPPRWHVVGNDPVKASCRQPIGDTWIREEHDWATPADAMAETGFNVCGKCTSAYMKSAPIRDLRNVDPMTFFKTPRTI